MLTSALLVTLLSFAFLFLAYRTYGVFLSRKVFQLDPNRKTPAHTLSDGVDFVPTKVPVLFGHHFASIAGLGPILGPALAVVWGWLPAVLWVVIGCIFMGAVHDLGSITVSMRFKGRSIGDVCRELIGPRARLLFLIIIFFAMSLAMGAFVNAISGLFINFNPDAIIPSFGLMVVAVFIGIAVYKWRAPLMPVTIIGLVIFAGLIAYGEMQPITTYEWFVSEPTQNAIAELKEKELISSPYGAREVLGELKKQEKTEAATELAGVLGTRDSMGIVQTSWIVVLLFYGFLASVLPVWLLLQPRDYINSFQLYFALGFMLLGLIVAALTGNPFADIHAEAIRIPGSTFAMPETISRPIIPFLFVTIACGAVSGFHSLVSSGTTVRQIDKETDALPIGYGAMLTEGALAILVIMACVAGLGAQAWTSNGAYSDWSKVQGLAPQLNAVVQGGANFLTMLGIPLAFASTFLAVTIVAFALTTLDSATRLLRFNVEELGKSLNLGFMCNRYVASLIAVCGIAMFGLVPGGRVLWTLFGTTNQLLASLALLAVSIFLYKLNRPIAYTIIPMAIMLTLTVYAMLITLQEFLGQILDDPTQVSPYVLFSVTVGILAISLWLMVEAALSFAKGRGGLEFDDTMVSKDAKEKPTSVSAS